MSGIDPQQFKESQRKSWDSVAAGLQEWWKTFENAAQKVSDHLVELAKINLNSRVLDIATGIGEPVYYGSKKNSYWQWSRPRFSDGHVSANAIYCKTKS